MAESAQIAVIRRLYAAKGDPSVLNATLSQDIRWEVVEGFPYSGVYEGIEAVLGVFFTSLMTDFEDWTSTPEEWIQAGDRVIALGHYSGRAKTTGKTFTARFAHVWTLKDSKIIRLQQTADTVQLANALEA